MLMVAASGWDQDRAVRLDRQIAQAARDSTG
jgi:hypothetical protein